MSAVIQPPGRAGSAQARDDVVERGVDADLEAPRRRAQRPADAQPGREQDRRAGPATTSRRRRDHAGRRPSGTGPVGRRPAASPGSRSAPTPTRSSPGVAADRSNAKRLGGRLDRRTPRTPARSAQQGGREVGLDLRGGAVARTPRRIRSTKRGRRAGRTPAGRPSPGRASRAPRRPGRSAPRPAPTTGPRGSRHGTRRRRRSGRRSGAAARRAPGRSGRPARRPPHRRSPWVVTRTPTRRRTSPSSQPVFCSIRAAS